MEENTNTQTNTNESGNKTPVIVGVVMVLLLIGGGLFLLNNKSKVESTSITDTTSTVTTGTTNQNEVQPESSVSATVKEFTVDGNNFSFGPKELTVNKGDTVKITFKDNDGMHNLVIDGYNVKTKIIKGGTEDSITFVADKSGKFEYYCSVGNHREQGMTGTLIVN